LPANLAQLHAALPPLQPVNRRGRGRGRGYIPPPPPVCVFYFFGQILNKDLIYYNFRLCQIYMLLSWILHHPILYLYLQYVFSFF
jgi:hypothetical protein